MSDAARHTALTRLFTGRPARGIVNRLMREVDDAARARVPARHRGDRAAARRRRGARQRRLLAALVGPERERLPRASRRRR